MVVVRDQEGAPDLNGRSRGGRGRRKADEVEVDHTVDTPVGVAARAGDAVGHSPPFALTSRFGRRATGGTVAQTHEADAEGIIAERNVEVPFAIDAELHCAVGDDGAVGTGVARVSETVLIAVGLVGVGDRGTVVADIADPIAVAVRLVRIGREGTVAALIRAERRVAAESVAVEIKEARIARASIAGVSSDVAVVVRLVPICHRGTVVAHLTDPIAVAVVLIRVGGRATIVHAVANVVAVVVIKGKAQGTHVADAVAIDVRLIGIGSIRTVVTGVANAVRVAVGLVRIECEWAVVASVLAEGRVAAEPVGVEVEAAPIERTHVASVADAVTVAIGLV